MSEERNKFLAEKEILIKEMSEDKELNRLSKEWFNRGYSHKYSYNFEWMGRPIIQYPQDMFAMQEIIWETKPDLIIETGIAHGGSIIYYASLLKLLGNNGRVIGIDIDIREHNRVAIESHPMADNIILIEGSSVEEETFFKVEALTEKNNNVLVILDSNHTHQHVIEELNLYSKLVSLNNYLVVYDTVIEDLPENSFPDRPWDIGDNPKTAVYEFLKTNNGFEIDKDIQRKLLVTVAPDGYLKRIK